MKKNTKKLITTILAIVLCVISLASMSYAHSGRTDSNGGHKDNKNISGLGSYHYHCGGHPAHLHPNGVCPYATSTTSTTTITQQQNTTQTNKTNTQNTTVKILTTSKNTANNTTNSDSNGSDTMAGILGAGGYWRYTKYKKSKKA